MPTDRPIIIATRGSALALAQAQLVLDQCRAAFPDLRFEIKIMKTTGDKLLTASMSNPSPDLPKGLFTKELEAALLKQEADLAVHSLKDLPTELPHGLKLGAVSKRADVRDVLIYRDEQHLAALLAPPTAGERGAVSSVRRGFTPLLSIKDLPVGVTIATSSTRRLSQIHALRLDVKIVEIRGNILTRLQKLADRAELDCIILAAAGLDRLNFVITPEGQLKGDAVPAGILATLLPLDIMLPCVGQAALGIEVRENDARIAPICERLNHYHTHQCVLAERAFLRAMGGGCQAPIGAHAEVLGDELTLRVIVFRGDGASFRSESTGLLGDAVQIGEQLAASLTA